MTLLEAIFGVLMMKVGIFQERKVVVFSLHE
jgi:hypothetical protein